MKLASLLPLSLIAAQAATIDSPLADAAKRMDRPAIQALLRQKVNPNAPQVDGATALHWAAYQEDVETVELLLKAGANAKAENRYGVTPLSLAATNGNGKIVELLLSAGASANTFLPGGETVLMTAARTGKPEAVRALIARNAEVNAKETKLGQTALMWAAADGNVEAVETLVAAKADIKATSKSGFTAFMFAVREGQIGTMKALIKAGSSPNEVVKFTGRKPGGVTGPPTENETALHLATTNGHYDLAAELLNAGADPNSDAAGFTALHCITNTRKPGLGDNDPAPQGSGNMTSLDLVKMLVAKGADINRKMTKKVNFGLTALNTVGATPFFLAAKTSDAELMKLLASLGADPSITNDDGTTPLMAAAGLGTRSPGEDAGTESEVLEALQVALDLGNNIDAVNKNGETAMHSAAYKNHPLAVQFLSDKGAKIEIWNKKNKFGWTPLVIAEGYRFGNFKPSPDTIAVFRKIMMAAGVPLIVDPPPGKGWQPEP